MCHYQCNLCESSEVYLDPAALFHSGRPTNALVKIEPGRLLRMWGEFEIDVDEMAMCKDCTHNGRIHGGMMELHPKVLELKEFFKVMGFDIGYCMSDDGREGIVLPVTEERDVEIMFSTQPCIGTAKDGTEHPGTMFWVGILDKNSEDEPQVGRVIKE